MASFTMRIPHFILGVALFVDPMKHLFKIESWDSSLNTITGLLPPLGVNLHFNPLPKDPFSVFMCNFCCMIGFLYLKTALTNDVSLAKNLMMGRTVLALLNAYGIFGSKQLPEAFLFHMVVEIITITWVGIELMNVKSSKEKKM